LNYGQRPPPVQNRPPPVSRPPPSPAPPNGADPALWPLFKAVDKDGISAASQALVTRLTIIQEAANSVRKNYAQPSSTATGLPSILTQLE
jgi:hypothetical protein